MINKEKNRINGKVYENWAYWSDLTNKLAHMDFPNFPIEKHRHALDLLNVENYEGTAVIDQRTMPDGLKVEDYKVYWK